jgi:LysM repeat protein
LRAGGIGEHSATVQSRIAFSLAVAIVVSVPATAQADFAHVVAPGESLTSVAAADGLSVSELAAANGVAPDAQLVAGTVVQIPPAGAGTSAGDVPAPAAATVSAAAPTSASHYVVAPGDTLSAIAARAGMTVGELAAANGLDPNAPLPSGTVLAVSAGSVAGTADDSPSSSAAPAGVSHYVVAPGDTLSAIAARAGTTVGELAAANGLDPGALLLSGTVLAVSGGSGAGTAGASTQPVGAPAEGAASGPPDPTPETVTASQVGQVANANGVPASLAAAVGWQESGLNNDRVSSADARGVMQILPGTWAWIQHDLNSGAPLAPASAIDNVRGGVLLLHWLLQSTGGDPGLAAAGYFQGLPSVQRYGEYAATQQYVNNVLALRRQFGGP